MLCSSQRPGHALQCLIGLRGAPGASTGRRGAGVPAAGGGLGGLGAAAAAEALPGDVAGRRMVNCGYCNGLLLWLMITVNGLLMVVNGY